VHGFDLSIVEEFPHPLPRLKGPEPPQHASRVICLVLASEGARPETDGLQIGAEMMKSRRRSAPACAFPSRAPTRALHPGWPLKVMPSGTLSCRHAWGSGTSAL
jgi:hypothetical protein